MTRPADAGAIIAQPLPDPASTPQANFAKAITLSTTRPHTSDLRQKAAQ